jgi:hypothetical protein
MAERFPWIDASYNPAPSQWTTDQWRSADDRKPAPSKRRFATEAHSSGMAAISTSGNLKRGRGILGAARISLTLEEQGGGRQMVRYRIWPRVFEDGSALA